MYRSIAKWYISRAIDCNTALPAWVERRVAQDSSLKQFYARSQQLAAGLRKTDSAAVDTIEFVGLIGHRTASANRSAAKLAALSIGLAAVLLLALFPFYYRSGSDSTAVSSIVADSSSEGTTKKNPAEPKRVDPKRLSEFVAGGRSLVQRLKQRAGDAAEPTIEFNYEQLSAFASLDVDQIIQPVNDLGSGYGALLSQFDHRIESENRQLISEGMGAWNFFTRKLPQSAASLASFDP